MYSGRFSFDTFYLRSSSLLNNSCTHIGDAQRGMVIRVRLQSDSHEATDIRVRRETSSVSRHFSSRHFARASARAVAHGADSGCRGHILFDRTQVSPIGFGPSPVLEHCLQLGVDPFAELRV